MGLFNVMGRCKRLGSLKSSISYASQLSGASLLCFSHPEFLSAHCREGLQPECGQTEQVSFFFLAAPEGWNHDDCDILVYWYGRKCSFSQRGTNIQTIVGILGKGILNSTRRVLEKCWRVFNMTVTLSQAQHSWTPFPRSHQQPDSILVPKQAE